MEKISVVMAVYNGADYLHEAIESVLKQTHGDFEFIIVDDGSTDSTVEIIEGFNDCRIRLVRQENQGLSRSLNRGIALGECELVARMDADDICHPTRFERQLEFMRQNPKCAVVGSNAEFIDRNGAYLYTSHCRTDWDDIRGVLPSSPHFHSSVMFRRVAFSRAGGYFERIPHFFEDMILWNRMSAFGELRNLPDVLLKYRIAPQSITAHKSVMPDLRAIALAIIQTGDISDQQLACVEAARATAKRNSRLQVANYHLKIGKALLEHQFECARAAKSFVRALFFDPLDPIKWVNLFLCALPRELIRSWKRRRGVYDRIW